MCKKLLVSLVSDQTVPNVQLIKQLRKNEGNEIYYLFITTEGMEGKGTRSWIQNACNISEKYSEKIMVDQFSFSDIKAKLENQDFTGYDKILVNLTGGTKIMTLVASDFFKTKSADIYYVTGRDNEYIKVFPKEEKKKKFEVSVSLEEYLKAYGFNFEKGTPSGNAEKTTETIFKKFCELNIMEYTKAIREINSHRGKTLNYEENGIVSEFLNAIDYNPGETGSLSKKETKYLSGDWFEEYIGTKIKKELKLSDDNIFISTELTKSSAQHVTNDINKLLGENEQNTLPGRNEIDVMFMYNNTFYSIECKTSIIAYRTIQNQQGDITEKEYNILGETIYKSDSLKGRFGLFAKTSILTLTDFKEYCGEDNNKKTQMQGVIDRANLSNIKLIDKTLLKDHESELHTLLGIKI